MGKKCREILQSLTSYRGNVRLPRQNIAAISPKYPFQAMRNVGKISAIFRENKAQNSFALLLHSTVWLLEHLVEVIYSLLVTSSRESRVQS